MKFSEFILEALRGPRRASSRSRIHRDLVKLGKKNRDGESQKQTPRVKKIQSDSTQESCSPNYISENGLLNEADGLDKDQVKRAEEIKDAIIKVIMKHPYYKAYQQIEDSRTGPAFWADKKYGIRTSRMREVFYEPWKPDDEPARLGTLMFRVPSSDDKNLNKKFEKFILDVIKVCNSKFACKVEYPKDYGTTSGDASTPNYGGSTVIYRFAL